MADPQPGSGQRVVPYEQLYDVLIQLGASNYEADQLAAIALAESGGSLDAHNGVGEDSWGPWQINLQAHPTMTSESATTLSSAATYALQLFRSSGTQPWSVTHDNWKGTDRDYRQFLRNEAGYGLVPSTPGTNQFDGNNNNAPLVIDDSRTQPGGDLSTVPGGGAFDNLQWPDPSLYPEYSDYLNVIGSIASTYALAGLPLPSGAPQFAFAAYEAAKADAASQNASSGPDPSTQALNYTRVQQINQEIEQGRQLFPYDLQKIQQDIRLAEPYGSERILRSGSGQSGYNDYWAGKEPNSRRLQDADYMSGYNLARAGDEPRHNAIADYLDKVITEVGDSITLRDQNIRATIEEFRTRADIFDVSTRAFKDIQPYTIPTGSEFIPGFEPGGFAESVGLHNQPSTPINYNPFQMGLDLVRNSPRPTQVPEPSRPSFMDENLFQSALNFYKELI